jgi:hypothetical protein
MPLRRPPAQSTVSPELDVYERTRWRDVEMALEVYQRESGGYPSDLAALVETEWLSGDQLSFPGYKLVYRPLADGQSYELTAKPGSPDSPEQ